jgi:hypothetical protein
MKVVIHVAQDAIRKNTKCGTNDPAIIVRRGAKPQRYHSVRITAPDGTLVGTFHYQPHTPLPCGARVWLELAEGCNVEV